MSYDKRQYLEIGQDLSQEWF